MRKPVIALTGLAALVLALVFSVSPHATSTANEASVVSGIDILELTKKANSLVEEHFPAY